MTHGALILPMVLAVALQLVSCGGGGSSDSGSGGGCEQVSAGNTSVSVQNKLSSGVEAYFPQLAFGPDMASGECNIVGFDMPGSTTSIDLRVELTQCSNSSGNTDCTGKKFGPTKVQTVHLAKGDSGTIAVNASLFGP